MAIDGCRHSFRMLATDILPGYMRQLRERMARPIPMAEFAVQGQGPVTIARRHGMAGEFGGCYVFLDGDRPIYVGISRKVCSRIRNHLQGEGHHNATLAYKMTAEHLAFEGTRDQAMQNPEFMAAFAKTKAYLVRLHIAFIEIENAVEMHLFELYAAMKLDTCEWNTFRTH